jgi:hypothetical protein
VAVTVLDGIEAVMAAVGHDLGVSDWLELTAERLAMFDAVIGPGAQEFLVLSLSNHFLPQILEVSGVSVGINYGTDSVRFGSPVEVGGRLRASARLAAADPIPGGVQTTIHITVEADGRSEPACEIDSLSRWLV